MLHLSTKKANKVEIPAEDSKGETQVRVSVDVRSPDLRSVSSSVSTSLEEYANGEISVSTNIR